MSVVATRRVPWDMPAYVRRVRAACFVCELVTGNPEYVHHVVHRAGRALTRVVPAERAYVLSLGSQQGNRHVHWHVVPLPPGVPYEEQQIEVFAESKGYLDADDTEMADLASRVRDAFEHQEA